MINVTIWNEFLNEKLNEEAKRIYPNGIHQALADGLADEGFATRTATLRDNAEHGLGEEILNSTDVLLWWGHKAHDQVSDEVTARVVKRVQEGMGLIVLHSGHFSKPFKALMGTSCDLKWRVAGEQEIIWSVNPSHPIAEGIDAKILLEQEEMYGEFFDIPAPDELVFISNFEGGEVFRTGCTFHRGSGKIFYFRPGHETYPTYYQPDILKVIANSIRWASPTSNKKPIYGRSEPVRPLGGVLV
ncbi:MULTISPECIES: ThuA domain-containing protein [Paenibacillus]|jgi:trehalose utilization protein|uniref:ThuA domain-containing protein n=1 Tax=Paenibacillus TaxID=44249 RepID=UPI000E3B8AB1|nr:MULTISPECIES: ThuA domain-containing protein [Paenibacillus]KAF6584186.1 ThuA domain-containing protein [Paenibacillus sp. EKM211P]MBY0023864.1 ThuA domain-containing protein [Paenibacillus polymyxa]MBY0056536.1 ThuA domain-containing protein [Paenibacillus polymyxa]MBY0071883.1 ThuA domain-containing protein [Paenibacillus polymyxa]MBY0080551.1 ThuA domain-containing protein [Paenibacillus polymyxa]